MQHGVLPSQQLRAFIKEKQIVAKNAAQYVQPNSFDLPLGKRCWRLRSIRLPRKNETVMQVIEELAIDELNLTNPCIFERNAVYIVELDVQFALPKFVYGQCDSKSSTGRVDVQTRLLTDYNDRYDFIPPGFNGKPYLFVSSNSFLIRLQAGICLNQARFISGEAVVSDADAIDVAAQQQLIFHNGAPRRLQQLQAHQGILLSLDLQQDVAGYRAKRTNAVVDLLRHDNPIELFWERIPGHVQSITLERNDFYILSTLEAIRVPPTYCVWLPPFRPEYGEFRSHYAGFLDSGFGYGTGELNGATITLEVRSQDNSLTLLHGTPVAPALFLKNAQAPDTLYGVGVKSNYQNQLGPKLAKFFR